MFTTLPLLQSLKTYPNRPQIHYQPVNIQLGTLMFSPSALFTDQRIRMMSQNNRRAVCTNMGEAGTDERYKSSSEVWERVEVQGARNKKRGQVIVLFIGLYNQMYRGGIGAGQGRVCCSCWICLPFLSRLFGDLSIMFKDSLEICAMEEQEQQLQLSRFVDPEKSISLTNCVSENYESGQDAIFIDEETLSTRQLRIAKEEFHFLPFYRLSSKILENSPITENMRARLRSFLLSESSKQHLLRQTYALAGNLVDLYFAKGGYVEVKVFQNFVIACLILACKIKEGRMPTISFDIFSKEELLHLQRKIAKRLTYMLTPITYYGVAERLIYLWDSFTAQKGLPYSPLANKQEGVNMKVRRFYQELDCAFMVLRTLDFDLEELVINHFYLAILRAYTSVPHHQTLSIQQFRQAYYPKSSQFKDHFFQFLNFYSERTIALNLEIGTYLKDFLQVQTSNPSWTIKATSDVIDKLKAWDMIQSIPKDNYALAKSVAEKYKGVSERKQKAEAKGEKPGGKSEKNAKKK